MMSIWTRTCLKNKSDHPKAQQERAQVATTPQFAEQVPQRKEKAAVHKSISEIKKENDTPMHRDRKGRTNTI